jgi:nitroreductase
VSDLNLDQYEKLVKARRATRHFKPDPIPQDLLRRLLDIARWAPSAYNLQPTHFMVVTDPEVKAKLRKACLDQPQIVQAPAVIVFAGDRDVAKHNFEKIIQMEKEAGVLNDKYESLLREFIKLDFSQGPLGFGWLWKVILEPVIRLLRPLHSMPAVHKKFWLMRQISLSAMTFMLAAQSAGLATGPMEGFDARRVKKVLNIPKRFVVPIITVVGYSQEGETKKTRLPLEDLLHSDKW